jgi:GNAT superfamily N-acetyltransferase
MVPMDDDPLPPGYPSEWEADVVLRDGTVAHVRPIRPSDTDGIHRFHSGQSEESIYLRFFAPLRRLSDADVHRFTHVDYVDRVALVVTLREDIVGIGRYDRIDARSAEVAFNISDHYQGKGIGSVLLEHLAAIARDVGITRFTAEVLPQNRKMLSVFSDAGYDVTRHIEDGVVEVGFDIEPTDSSKAVAMSREHRAEALSVAAILHPRTIAVIGASRRRNSIGSQLLERIVAAGFTGEIHPVNPNVRTLRRRTAYPSVAPCPDGSTLRSSPSRPTRCSRSSTSAPRRGSRRCSSSRAGSRRRAVTAPASRQNCCAGPAGRGCGSSGRTPSG